MGTVISYNFKQTCKKEEIENVKPYSPIMILYIYLNFVEKDTKSSLIFPFLNRQRNAKFFVRQ